VLSGAALAFSAQHLFLVQTPLGKGDDTLILGHQLRLAALALVVFSLLWAVGTVPALTAVWRFSPLAARLEAVASFLIICVIAFLAHPSTLSLVVEEPLWGLLWSATFVGGCALGLAGLLLVWAWPHSGAERVIALGMLASSIGAITTSYDDAGWAYAWVIGWLLLAIASSRPMSPTIASDDYLRLASIGRTVPVILFMGALVSVAFAWMAASATVFLWAALVVVALALGRRLAAPGADGRSGWRDWRARLGTPGILLTVLGATALWLVGQTLLVGRPDQERTAIAFAVRDFYPEALNGFRIDVLMEAATGPFGIGCRNPVVVTAVISGTPEMWKQASGSLGNKAHFGIAVASSGAVRGLRAGLADDATAPIRPPPGYADLGPPIDPTVKASFRLLDPFVANPSTTPNLGGGSGERVAYSVSGSIEDWKSSWIPLVVKFEADWVQRRSVGSCYVLLPSLTGNAQWGSRDALEAAVEAAVHGRVGGHGYTEARKRVAASHGRILLSVNADVLGDASSPAPASPVSGQLTTTWTCSSSPLDTPAGHHGLPRSPSGQGLALPSDQRLPESSGCGGFAVVTTSESQLLRELSLITIGVLVSMIVEIAYSEARSRP
jgi:hypothetical protein